MKHVAIVAPHFVPSNRTAVHRARLLAESLPAFGWAPTIITVHERHYEEPLEPELLALLPSGLPIEKVSAWPAWATLGIHDIGIRGFFGLLRAIRRAHNRRPIDFLLITVPSHYVAPLGRLASAQLGVPYGIDYIDPWVHAPPEDGRRLGKAWWAHRVAVALEPWTVRRAALLTGIAPSYYEGVLARNPAVRARVVTAAMPYGWSETEYRYLAHHPHPTSAFSRDGQFHMVYAGALLPRAQTVFRRLLDAIAALAEASPEPMRRFRLHLIGTGARWPGLSTHRAAPYLVEHPDRMPYLDVLRHLDQASAVLLLGSTEAHYAPSKVFQSLLARRPVLAVLHEASPAVPILAGHEQAHLLTMTAQRLPEVPALQEGLRAVITAPAARPADRAERLAPWSAQRSAEQMAHALDRAVANASGRA